MPEFGVQSAPDNRVALTFDDGPSEWTGAILDVLDVYGAKASFFVLGQYAAKDADTVREIRNRGHELCNHTQTHPNLAYLPPKETLIELADCSQAILEAAGVAPHFYRPPFLNDTPMARAAGYELGMMSVECDVIGYDWDESDPAPIVSNVLGGVGHGGKMVLLHDGVPPDRDGNRQPTVDALKEIVPSLLEDGFHLVTVSELLGV